MMIWDSDELWVMENNIKELVYFSNTSECYTTQLNENTFYVQVIEFVYTHWE
jgi:hypothetical protein